MTVVNAMRQPSPVTDLDLARAAGQEDPAACRALVDRLLERVRTTVRMVVAGDRDADDLVQVSLIAILDAAGTFRGESRLETWADRITVRTVMRHLKQRGKREQLGEGDLPELVISPEAEGELDRQRIAEVLTAMLQKLPPKQRVAVMLRVVHDHSLEEIAELTGTSVLTVRGRLRLGMARLRQSMARRPALLAWAEARNA